MEERPKGWDRILEAVADNWTETLWTAGIIVVVLVIAVFGGE